MKPGPGLCRRVGGEARLLGLPWAVALAALLVVVAFTADLPDAPGERLLLFWAPSERARVAHSITNSLHRVRTWLFGLASHTRRRLKRWCALAAGVPYAPFGLLAMLEWCLHRPVLAAVPGDRGVSPGRSGDLGLYHHQQLENLSCYQVSWRLRVHRLIVFGLLVLGTLFRILGLFLAVPLMAIGQAGAGVLPPRARRRPPQTGTRSRCRTSDRHPEPRAPPDPRGVAPGRGLPGTTLG